VYFSNGTQTILLSKVILSLKLEGSSLKLRKLRKETRKTVILSLKDPASVSRKKQRPKKKKKKLQGFLVKLSEDNLLISL